MSKRNEYWTDWSWGRSRQFGKRMQRARWWKRMRKRSERATRIRARQWRGRHTAAWENGNPEELPF